MAGATGILIADSGSSKTEWKLIGTGTPADSIISTGINPYFLSSEDIFSLLEKELPELNESVIGSLYFYGTGCNSPIKEDIVRKALASFTGCNDIFVGSDLLGAARSLCQDKPGIACIMGTGSNSCYYDGSKIAANIPPLGYILGDEGGGAVLGRKLISSILKKQVPDEVREIFLARYKLTTAEILDNVYTKPFPNRFLGQFARFLAENMEIPEFKEIVVSSFDDFIRRNILQYPESSEFPVHFTGSIAWHFSTLLKERIEKNGLSTGQISLTPMEGLVQYHLNILS
jgi:glucosamine kinase